MNSPFDYLRSQRIEQKIRQALEETQKAHQAMLSDLIPLLPEQAATLTRKQWQALYSVLKDRRQKDEIILKVLKALQQHADRADLPYLTHWANTVAYLWANENESIADAAATCLPILQARINKEKFGSTLLRPATDDGKTEELLRPAGSGAEVAPETLLRPMNEESEA